jgi:hypothetical protein
MSSMKAIEVAVRKAVDEMGKLNRRYPGRDYDVCVYNCAACSGVHVALAPAVELVDDYPCPVCGAPQTVIPGCQPRLERPDARECRHRGRRHRAPFEL